MFVTSKQVNFSRFLRCISAIVLLTSLAPIAVANPPKDELTKTAIAFMDAYVSGNWSGVVSHLTAGELTIYGSDSSEFSTSREAFKTMFDNDQKLWQGQAHFGPLSHVSSFRYGNVGTLFFDRVFELGDRKMLVRFSTVWRKEGGEWKLVQSSNVVPTTGQSAAAILSAQKK